jgi:hypothetical protein
VDAKAKATESFAHFEKKHCINRLTSKARFRLARRVHRQAMKRGIALYDPRIA